MPEIGRFGGVTFEVTQESVLGFSDLKIKASLETDESTTNKTSYITVKASKPTEVSMNVHVDTRLGMEARETAMKLVDMAKQGEEDYFYIESRKLVPYKLKLTDAQVSDVQMTPLGVWICCTVGLTLKQSTVSDAAEETKTSAKSSGYSLSNSDWIEDSSTTTTKKSSGTSTKKESTTVYTYNPLTGGKSSGDAYTVKMVNGKITSINYSIGNAQNTSTAKKTTTNSQSKINTLSNKSKII